MLRNPGRAIVIVGLAMFYGTIVFGVADFDPPEVLFLVGAAMAAVGCLWLTGVLVWAGERGTIAFEAALGFMCLPAALLSLFGASETREVSWVIVTVFLLAGVVTLIGQAARLRREAEAWRNSGDGDR